MHKITIDRCLCFNKPFSLLKQVAKEKNIYTIDDLQKTVLFGKKCKLCLPYVKHMLKSGIVLFTTILK